MLFPLPSFHLQFYLNQNPYLLFLYVAICKKTSLVRNKTLLNTPIIQMFESGQASSIKCQKKVFLQLPFCKRRPITVILKCHLKMVHLGYEGTVTLLSLTNSLITTLLLWSVFDKIFPSLPC